MKVCDIYDILDSISPFDTQEEWDNSGLLVGSMNSSVSSVYLALDIDLDLCDSLENGALVITHHPLIFKGLKEINIEKYPSNVIFKMAKKDISLIAMHTNYDKSSLNRYVATKVLGYKDVECDGFVCYFDVDDDFESFLKRVELSFKLECIKSVRGKKFIKKAALTTGSGADLIPFVKADCFLTGDIKYHQAYEAMENGMALIDIGHFESEIYFADSLYRDLKKFDIQAIIANSKNPFTYQIINKDK